MTQKIRIKKLNDNAVIPAYGTGSAAGADLFACTDGQTVTVGAGETQFIGTGIAVEIPDGYVGLICARSGISCKRGLAPANKVGVIDSDYRGEIKVALHNHSAESQSVEDKERIAQLVIVPYLTADFEVTDRLDDTVRGESGFGSTGRK